MDAEAGDGGHGSAGQTVGAAGAGGVGGYGGAGGQGGGQDVGGFDGGGVFVGGGSGLAGAFFEQFFHEHDPGFALVAHDFEGVIDGLGVFFDVGVNESAVHEVIEGGEFFAEVRVDLAFHGGGQLDEDLLGPDEFGVADLVVVFEDAFFALLGEADGAVPEHELEHFRRGGHDLGLEVFGLGLVSHVVWALEIKRKLASSYLFVIGCNPTPGLIGKM